MFDVSKQFTVRILSGTVKQCTVRFPSDAEWCERARRIKGIRRMLGRGKSEYEAGDGQGIDAEFLAKIRVEGDNTEFNGAESSHVVDRLTTATITNVSRSGDNFRIELRHFGADLVHVLKIPTQADMVEYGRASVKVIDARRTQEIRVNLEPSGTLWDRCRVDAMGYEGPVPIVHKDTAIVELLAQVAELEEELLGPE